MFEIQAQKDYTFNILYVCISIDEPMVHDLLFFLLISSRLADTPLQEHDSSSANIPTNYAVLMQKNFRSAIQKKNAKIEPCVYWHSA